MEILIGLVVATLCILGIVAGSAFAATFATIPICGMILLALAGAGPASGAWIVGCLIALVVIWVRVAAKHSATP